MARLFVALPVPPAVRSRLGAVQEALSAAGLPFRWVRGDGLHLTLVFIGERPAAEVPAAGRALRRAVAGRAPFELRCAGLGGFPGLVRPRVLWAGLEGDLAALGDLQRGVSGALHAAGLPFDRRPFRAHVTLGRAGAALDGAAAAALQAAAQAAPASWGSWTADSVELMESRLLPGGAVYTAVDRASLRAAAASRCPGGAGGVAGEDTPASRREEALR
jgi:2'-5' RNA ligase